jgi:hypothetical protein
VIVLLLIAALLVAARLAMAPALLWYVNRTLDRDPLYEGQVEDLSISLWRGAYTVHGITLQKRGAGATTLKPLLTMDRLDLSLQWSALLNASIVGDVSMTRPIVNFIDGGSSGESQTGGGGPWLEMLQDLLPFTINRVQVDDGEVHFYTEQAGVPVDAYISEIKATVTDLTNVQDKLKPLVTQVEVTGRAMGQAELELLASFDPFSYHPTFELAIKMLNFDVTQINEIAQVYGGIDFKEGRFDLTIEASAVRGQIEGMIKPLFRDLDVYSDEQDLENGDLASAAWEALVGVAIEIFENQPRDQFGTRIPFSTDSAGLDYDLFEVINNLLYNAFIQAYLPKLRQQAVPGYRFGPTEPITADRS